MYRFFFFKQKTAYDMRISDWSSDVCSSDLKLSTNGFDLCLILRVRRICSNARRSQQKLARQRRDAAPRQFDPVAIHAAADMAATRARLKGGEALAAQAGGPIWREHAIDRKSTRLNSSH